MTRRNYSNNFSDSQFNSDRQFASTGVSSNNRNQPRQERSNRQNNQSRQDRQDMQNVQNQAQNDWGAGSYSREGRGWGGQYEGTPRHSDGLQNSRQYMNQRDSNWDSGMKTSWNDKTWEENSYENDYGHWPQDKGGQFYAQGHAPVNDRMNRSAGSFEGRGPKGYKRSDDRIKEDVCECLSRSPALDASEIEVDVKGACVTLSGSVHAREDKRQAERMIENLRGVEDVKNEIRVSKVNDYEGNSSSDEMYNTSKPMMNAKSDTKGSSFSSKN